MTRKQLTALDWNTFTCTLADVAREIFKKCPRSPFLVKGVTMSGGAARWRTTPTSSTTFGCLRSFITIVSCIKDVMVSMSASSVENNTLLLSPCYHKNSFDWSYSISDIKENSLLLLLRQSALELLTGRYGWSASRQHDNVVHIKSGYLDVVSPWRALIDTSNFLRGCPTLSPRTEPLYRHPKVPANMILLICETFYLIHKGCLCCLTGYWKESSPSSLTWLN